MIYQMLLTLLSASIMQRSENGTHYKWDVHSSLPSRRYRERKCHASWPEMPAPEIRLLRFDFLPPPLPTLSTLPLHFSILSYLTNPGPRKLLEILISQFRTFFTKTGVGILISPCSTYFLQLPSLSPTIEVTVIAALLSQSYPSFPFFCL